MHIAAKPDIAAAPTPGPAGTQTALAPSGLLSQLRPAITLIILFTIVTGAAFPLAFVGLGRLALPYQSGGSLIIRHGQVTGSALIGQAFTAAGFLHGRPSALMGTDPKDATKQIATPYDAGESGASNLAATSAALHGRVAADVKALGAADIPADAVTSSASGLDPDISPAFAAMQIPRIAAARKRPPEQVAHIVAAHTSAPWLGFIGAARVNVLAVNLDLDAAHN